MPDSPVSTVLLLPFGSLTGIVPVDAIPREREIRDVSNFLASSNSRLDPTLVAEPQEAEGRGRHGQWK